MYIYTLYVYPIRIPYIYTLCIYIPYTYTVYIYTLCIYIPYKYTVYMYPMYIYTLYVYTLYMYPMYIYTLYVYRTYIPCICIAACMLAAHVAVLIYPLYVRCIYGCHWAQVFEPIEWEMPNLEQIALADTCERLEYSELVKAEEAGNLFVESHRAPAAIAGACSEWPANHKWQLDQVILQDCADCAPRLCC